MCRLEAFIPLAMLQARDIKDPTYNVAVTLQFSANHITAVANDAGLEGNRRASDARRVLYIK